MKKRGPKPRKTYTKIGNTGIDTELLFKNLEIDDPAGCYIWQGARHRQGYGMIACYDYQDNKKTMDVTHRVSKMLDLGRELGRYEFVYHACGNNLCCNPKHLLIGAPEQRSEIIRECRELGMLPDPTPQRRQYKYSDDEVRWIRTADIGDIAEKYSMDRSRASSLRGLMRRRFYQWVK